MTLKLVPIHHDPKDPRILIPKPNNDHCFCSKKLKPSKHPVWGHAGGADGQTFDALHEKCLESWCIKMGQMQISPCVICRRNVDVAPLFPWIKKIRIATSGFWGSWLPMSATTMAAAAVIHGIGSGCLVGVAAAFAGVIAGETARYAAEKLGLKQEVKRLEPKGVTLWAMTANAAIAFGVPLGFAISTVITLLSDEQKRSKFIYSIILLAQELLVAQQMMRSEEEQALLFGASCTIFTLLSLAAVYEVSRSHTSVD